MEDKGEMMKKQGSIPGNTARQTIKAELEAVQSALRDETISISVANDAIIVTVNGYQNIRSIEIDPTLLHGMQEADRHWLQQTLTMAINRAIEHSQSLALARYSALAESSRDLMLVSTNNAVSQ